ncbi:ankyrin repeat and SOCS box protein 2-like [Oncorhynchus keta]|uniref:ankyrin repeat and SOCS box protein 2-like n=1 Tax=Oncorhynchus keta TaxID=8018 RepID=UPI00227B0C5E|nr:ankyrin repeat and SOCS box protein 2-like [Oncorhynchus keta]
MYERTQAALCHFPCNNCHVCNASLQAGPDPDISSKNKETPLYKACEWENDFQSRSDVIQPGFKPGTVVSPLALRCSALDHCATREPQIVSLILSFGATVNQRCNRGWTALHEAVCRDNIEIWYFRYFIRIPISCCKSSSYSSWGPRESLFPQVLTSTCRRDSATALYEASKNCHWEIVELQFSPNTDANKPTKTGLLPLHVAAPYGHHENVRVHCVSPVVSLVLLLCTVLMSPCSSIVYMLVPVTSRARVRHNMISPLHLATEHNRDMATAILLKKGANVNATLSHNRSLQYSDHCITALYFSISNGSTIAAILLAAVRRGCARTVSLLLEHGADNTSIPFCPTTFPGAIILCMNNLPLLKFAFGQWLKVQFCELISSTMCNWAGPIVDLLLDYVGDVQLCARLTELLDGWHEWPSIKTKSLSAHPLMHLCRLRIHEQMVVSRLRSLDSLPLPETAAVPQPDQTQL